MVTRFPKEEVLARIDVRLNGTRPWDIRVHNPDFYSRVLAGGSLALGESDRDGWWDCRDLDVTIERTGIIVNSAANSTESFPSV